jgi:diadenosine tetraphosphatase ApaH/serine/threonine PP2A family protein phosphatase
VFELTPTEAVELHGPPRTFTLRPDRKYIVSVGSVGQPRDYDNRASYVTYDTESRQFNFKRAEYDIESAAQKILRAARALGPPLHRKAAYVRPSRGTASLRPRYPDGAHRPQRC